MLGLAMLRFAASLELQKKRYEYSDFVLLAVNIIANNDNLAEVVID